MKILHIGRNDGSHITRTVRMLRKQGHDVCGISFYYSQIVNYEAINVYKKKQFLKYYINFINEAIKADLVHLWSIQLPFIVPFLKLIRKPFVIEWTGMDIRNPELMDKMYYTGDYEYNQESKEHSYKNQKPFKNTVNIVSSAILGSHLVNKHVEYLPHRICLEDYRFNATIHNPIRVAHAPSARGVKGTQYVLDAVKELPIDFRLIEKVSHKECIKQMAECDIFLDQFVWGEHGMASMEAMALGKPVLCYINHNRSVGVVQCKPEEIKSKLLFYISHPEMIIEDGKKARKYVEENQPLNELINIYKSVVSKLIYSRKKNLTENRVYITLQKGG